MQKVPKQTKESIYTPLQKKCNTWFRSPHDPSLGSATPRGKKIVSRGRMFRMVDFGGYFFWGLWDLVEDNSEEKPLVPILSRFIHIIPGLIAYTQ